MTLASQNCSSYIWISSTPQWGFLLRSLEYIGRLTSLSNDSSEYIDQVTLLTISSIADAMTVEKRSKEGRQNWGLELQFSPPSFRLASLFKGL